MIPGITSAMRRRPRPASRSRTAVCARSFAVVTASTAGTAHEPDATDLCTHRDRGRHAGAADGRRTTRRHLPSADRRGTAADEPAALVMWATTPEERTVIGSLTELPALAAAASLGPPATLIVGDVAAIRSRSR